MLSTSCCTAFAWLRKMVHGERLMEKLMGRTVDGCCEMENKKVMVVVVDKACESVRI